MTSRQIAWCGGAVAVLACAALGIYFGSVGLSKANALAGVIGLFVAVAGLGVSAWGILAARRAQVPGGQVVADSRVGSINQVGSVGGNARISRGSARPEVPASSGPVVLPTSAADPGGQTVTGSEVTGTVSQIGNVGGDLDIG
jgi:hypothetical protein